MKQRFATLFTASLIMASMNAGAQVTANQDSETRLWSFDMPANCIALVEVEYDDEVTVDDLQPATYNGQPQTPTITVKAGENTLDASEYSVTAPSDITNAGNNKTYTIKVKNNAGGNLADINKTYTINPKQLTITAEAKSKTYGENDPVFTYKSDGLVGSDAITGTLTRVAGKDVGSYAINQGSLTAGDNYNISYTKANLTINQRPLTIAAETKEKTYGENDPAFTYTSSGLVGEDVISGTLERAAGNNVGSYAINQGSLTAGDNYNISYSGANLTINKKELIVAAEDKQKLKGEDDPELTFTATGFAYDEDESVITGALAREEGEDAGEYAILQGTLEASNYTISFNNGAKLTISEPPTGLEEPAVASDLKVWSFNHNIYIANAPFGSQYAVTNLSGSTVESGSTQSTREVITIGATGVYIVVIDGQTFKVQIR
ncbi:MAG: hypothetical protein J6Y82_10225 [Bacteroidales bacterium]|nr:hypothetical protein [Bacteroidales bacterium]